MQRKAAYRPPFLMTSRAQRKSSICSERLKGPHCSPKLPENAARRMNYRFGLAAF
jgi:hypothetical protein